MMRIQFKFIGVFVLLCGILLNAHASSFPERYSYKNDQSPLVLKGAAERSFLFFSVYDIALYTFKDTEALQAPYMLWIQYQRDLSKSSVSKALIKGLKKNTPESHLDEVLEAFARQLKDSLSDVVEGDDLKLLRLSDEVAMVFYRDQLVGELEGQRFLDSLYAIWLGADSVVSRENLLGHH